MLQPITTVHYLVLSASLLLIGTIGVLTRRNIVIILMSIELILNAVNINLIAYSAQLQNVIGQVFAVFVIAVAAAEDDEHDVLGLRRARQRQQRVRQGAARHRGGGGGGGGWPGHHSRVLPQQGNGQHRRNEPDEVLNGGLRGLDE